MRMRGPRLVLFLPLALLILQGRGFELQDTIHALIEENIHLHDQLENLTQGLRELKQLLWHHSNDPNHEHDVDIQHLWDEWSEHGISAETHLLLEHALCGHDAHGSASPLHVHPPLFLITLPCITVLLLGAF
ncbi:uncharacterized protein ACWYII_045143 [Salvelinus alpinus]